MHDAAELVESYRFNVVVARVMELVNATRKAIDSGCGPADPAVREAAEAVAILLSLVAPYTAEEMWERLGTTRTSRSRSSAPGGRSSTRRCWSRTRSPRSCRSRARSAARLEVAPGHLARPSWRPLAMADAGVQRAIDGATVRKVIVRAPKLVNIVV